MNQTLAIKRTKRHLWRKRIKKIKKRKKFELYLKVFGNQKVSISYEYLLENHLPTNLKYLLYNEDCIFYIKNLFKANKRYDGFYKVPETFSIVENPDESYNFLRDITAALILQWNREVKIDYINCKRLELNAQVLLDIILKDIIAFFKICNSTKKNLSWVVNIGGINVNDEDIKKLLFSVGSPAIHTNKTIHYKDIISYKLCIHNRDKYKNDVKNKEQKDVDTTKLADYVLDSLKRLNKTLTPEKIDDLCTIIGEILINAEEHSTTKHRFSIGYFQETNQNNEHFGIFRLVILNFGKTIYEKFKDPNCPNQEIVAKMRDLSHQYTQKRIFKFGVLEEETLWTLYALQEGVTSISTAQYRKRGNGSIQFIESFFNLKGNEEDDKMSKMSILSGKTQIIFDGTYNISEKNINSENFKVMTFNDSGNIENKPDTKFVKFVPNYFPGTIISARIQFKEDEII